VRCRNTAPSRSHRHRPPAVDQRSVEIASLKPCQERAGLTLEINLWTPSPYRGGKFWVGDAGEPIEFWWDVGELGVVSEREVMRTAAGRSQRRDQF
jgi:hypothetical protein